MICNQGGHGSQGASWIHRVAPLGITPRGPHRDACGGPGGFWDIWKRTLPNEPDRCFLIAKLIHIIDEKMKDDQRQNRAEADIKNRKENAGDCRSDDSCRSLIRMGKPK